MIWTRRFSRREGIANVLEHGFAVTCSNQIRGGYPIFLDKIAFDAFSAPLRQFLVVGARSFGIGVTGNNKVFPVSFEFDNALPISSTARAAAGPILSE